MKVDLAGVDGYGVEGDPGYGIECAVQGIEVQEIVLPISDQGLARLLAEHPEAQAGGAKRVQNCILCRPIDALGGSAIRPHPYHLRCSTAARHLPDGRGCSLGRLLAQTLQLGPIR